MAQSHDPDLRRSICSTDGSKPHCPPLLPSWLAQDSATLSNGIRSAITHQFDLEGAISKVEKHILTVATTTGGKGDAQDILASLRASTAGLRHFISSLAHPLLFNERTSSIVAHRRAQEVFEVPELLEMILSFADMKSILCMMQVGRFVISTIRSSSRLQRQLHLSPDIDSFLQVPSLLRDCPGFKIEATCYEGIRAWNLHPNPPPLPEGAVYLKASL